MERKVALFLLVSAILSGTATFAALLRMTVAAPTSSSVSAGLRMMPLLTAAASAASATRASLRAMVAARVGLSPWRWRIWIRCRRCSAAR